MKMPNLLRASSLIGVLAAMSLVPSLTQATGIIDTVAGGGTGDGLPALQVGLATPLGVAVDSAGNRRGTRTKTMSGN